jgi:hypothetical protein
VHAFARYRLPLFYTTHVTHCKRIT